MRKAPKPREAGGQHKRIGDEWNSGHDSVLKDMQNAILSDPILQRPDVTRRFYLKTDYSSKGYGAALCQADGSKEARRAEQEEEGGGICQFDKRVTGLRLHPILFESKAIEGPHQSDHSHPGELKAGDFAIQKFRTFLWGKPFTWIADCISLKAFFEQRDMPSHQMERLRMRMLCFQFTVVHRNASMVKEVDLLTRYNKFAQTYRDHPNTTIAEATTSVLITEHSQPIGATNFPIMFAGDPLAPKTEAAKRWARDTVVVLGTAGFGEAEHAIEAIGRQPVIAMAVETNETLRRVAEERLDQMVYASTEDMLQNLQQAESERIPVDIIKRITTRMKKEQRNGYRNI